MPNDLEKRLAEIIQRLPVAWAEALLDYAEFLHMRHSSDSTVEDPVAKPAKIPEPLDIPRPADETVVKAVKRLRATYPMLDARKLLNRTSDLMTQHVIQGREKTEVIEELEILFRSQYVQLIGDGDKGKD